MSHLLFDLQDHIATLTLNNPKQRNAYSPEMAVKLTQYLRQCDRDPDVRVVIITGAGDSFCVGLDLNDVRERAKTKEKKRSPPRPKTTPPNAYCAPTLFKSPSLLSAPLMAQQAALARPIH